MIREATIDDVPELMRMTKNFYDNSHFPEFANYNKDTMIHLLIQMISDEGAMMLVAEGDEGLVGTLAILIYPYYFNHEVFTAQELWWWVDEEVRGSSIGVKLLKESEKLLQEIGVSHFTMMSITSSSADKVNNMYEKMGYKLTEYSYIKELG